MAKCKKEILEIIQDEEVTETMECPAGIVGRIIGRGGETIRALQSASQVGRGMGFKAKGGLAVEGEVQRIKRGQQGRCQ